MRAPEGGFYSALDADSEGVEGKFYVWTARRGARACSATTPTPRSTGSARPSRGNFEGTNILGARPASSRRPTLERSGAALYEARAKRVWPGLDDKRLTAWNALMISALADAGAVLERAATTSTPRAPAPSSCCGELRDADGRLLRTWKDGEAKLNAYLEDHAFLLEALLTLYEATLRPALVRRGARDSRTR